LPSREVYILDKKAFKNLRLLNRNNSVLVRIDTKNVNRRTKLGIYVVGDTDFNQHAHADRIGIVEWIPEHLNLNDMDWETDVEVQKDDVVWFDYMASLNCQAFDVDGVEYKMIHYRDLYFAKRGEKVFPLNGVCLFELVDAETPESKYAINTKKKKDVRYGIGKYMSTPNRKYKDNLYVDDERIKEGTKAIFGMPPILLEDMLHAEFGGDQLRISERKFVLGWDEGGRVYPTKNNVVIKPDKPKEKTEGGIITPLRVRDIKNVEEGVVVESDAEGLRRGVRVRFAPNIQGSSYVPDKKHGIVYLTRSNNVYVKFS